MRPTLADRSILRCTCRPCPLGSRSQRAFRANDTRAAERVGFTLVEVVVATLLLAVGALGVASASTYAAKLGASAREVERATTALVRVNDSLRSVPCAALTSGSVGTPAGTATWSVTTSANTARIATSFVPASPRLARSLVTETLRPCE